MKELHIDNEKNFSSKALQKVASTVRDFYKNLDFAHGIEHGERVVFLAKRINEEEGGSSFLIEAGAWLHQFHDNLDELQEILSMLPISEKYVEKFFEIVVACRPYNISEESSLEARIVFDADALELTGPYGIMRETLCNVVARQMSWDDALRNAENTQRLFESKLQTDTAKKLAQQSTQIAHDFWNEYRRWRKLDI